MAIEREKILDAAVAVLNEVGLDQLTTRRIAERLGVQQPALYWHFRSKSDLLDALNEVILTRFGGRYAPRAGESWEEFTLANARSFRKAMLAVRDGARINAGTRPVARQFRDAEEQLRLYVDAGFSAEEAFTISIAVARYVVGFVLEEQGERERPEDELLKNDDPMAEVAPFPLLTLALAPLMAAGSINTEEVFESGLRYMIDGMRLSLERSAQKRPPTRRRPPPPPKPEPRRRRDR